MAATSEVRRKNTYLYAPFKHISLTSHYHTSSRSSQCKNSLSKVCFFLVRQGGDEVEDLTGFREEKEKKEQERSRKGGCCKVFLR